MQMDLLEWLEVAGFRPQSTTQTASAADVDVDEDEDEEAVAPPMPAQSIEVFKNCVTQLMLYTGDKLSSTIFCCLSVCEASVSPDQISTFSNIYRHTSPLLTQYNLILSSTELY